MHNDYIYIPPKLSSGASSSKSSLFEDDDGEVNLKSPALGESPPVLIFPRTKIPALPALPALLLLLVR